ncbi:Casein kinase I isoform alpha [Mycena venus]|uniref:Casein kinase I isoform alpha n=1 Tax=Mycena venus TaxID=2733690 RepID=A0A8H7CTZ0_9AGAR|nr:Casein kinase I isoform alpha [Mycena venus]
MGRPAPTRVPRPILPSLPFLKRPSSQAYNEILALEFLHVSNRKASILNCAVVGPDICPYFHVVTRPGHTFIRTNEGRGVASVEWVPNGGGAYVELKNESLEKQLVSVWLVVSPDASYRLMHAHGQTYVWVPQSLSICLYEWDPRAREDVPQLLARIAKEDNVVTLQISPAAIEAGLLEMCVVCVVLFQSGYRID